MDGGGQTYLSDVDLIVFQSLAQDASDDASCLSTAVAASIAFKLKSLRRKKSEFMLCVMKMNRLASHLEEVEPPCKEWVKKICEDIDLKVAKPQELDILRRTYCDHIAIENFFSNFLILLNRDPHLLLNMDETMLSGKRKLKVVCRRNSLPLKTAKVQAPHISGAGTVSASGFLFETMYNLTNKKTMRNLESKQDVFSLPVSVVT